MDSASAPPARAFRLVVANASAAPVFVSSLELPEPAKDKDAPPPYEGRVAPVLQVPPFTSRTFHGGPYVISAAGSAVIAAGELHEDTALVVVPAGTAAAATVRQAAGLARDDIWRDADALPGADVDLRDRYLPVLVDRGGFAAASNHLVQLARIAGADARDETSRFQRVSRALRAAVPEARLRSFQEHIALHEMADWTLYAPGAIGHMLETLVAQLPPVPTLTVPLVALSRGMQAILAVQPPGKAPDPVPRGQRVLYVGSQEFKVGPAGARAADSTLFWRGEVFPWLAGPRDAATRIGWNIGIRIVAFTGGIDRAPETHNFNLFVGGDAEATRFYSHVCKLKNDAPNGTVVMAAVGDTLCTLKHQEEEVDNLVWAGLASLTGIGIERLKDKSMKIGHQCSLALLSYKTRAGVWRHGPMVVEDAASGQPAVARWELVLD